MSQAISQERRLKAVEDYLARKASASQGTTIEQVALDHNMSTASLKRFLRQHRGGPVRPPLPNRGGPQPRLSPAQRKELVELVLKTPTMNLGAISRLAEETFGMTVSETTIRRCLKESGLSKRALKKKGGPSPKQDRQESQRRYKERHRRKPEPRPHRRAYPSDFTDKEWAFFGDKFEEIARSGPKDHSTRDVLEALRFIGATGVPWRFLPHDFPPHTTVRRWFDTWTRDGTIERVNDWLRRCLRRRSNLEDTPSYLIIDSQSVKTSQGGQARGYDGGKKIFGRKRHIAVDSLGLPWLVCVHSAGVQDRDGVALLVPDNITEELPRLRQFIADGGYQGRCVRQTEARTGVPMRIVKRSDSHGAWQEKDAPIGTRQGGFVPLPERWKAERTLAWGSSRRRLAKDHERTTTASESWLRMSFQHIMVARAVG